MKKILCICFSATYQRSVIFDKLTLEKVNRTDNYGLYASGKAVNTARILSQLEPGCAITLCPLGKENLADFIKLAEQDNLNLSYIEVPGKIRECWTLLDRAAATTTELVVNEKTATPDDTSASSAYEIKFLKLLNQKIDECDGVILAGSRQGHWSHDIYSVIAGMAQDAGKTFLADYIGEDLQQTLKSNPTAIIKINDDEFCSTFDISKENLRDELKKISREKKNPFIITRGTDSTLAAVDGKLYECPVEKLVPVNTTACGDSFNAGFMYEFLNTGDFDAALKKGTWCAARNALNVAPGSIF